MKYSISGNCHKSKWLLKLQACQSLSDLTGLIGTGAEITNTIIKIIKLKQESQDKVLPLYYFEWFLPDLSNICDKKDIFVYLDSVRHVILFLSVP